MTLFWVAVISVLIGTTLYVAVKERRQAFVLLKPLTTLMIIALAVFGNFENQSAYGNLVVAGLLFSLAGDIFLLDKEKNFTKGLVAFLIAHIFYTVAFNNNIEEYCGVIILPILLFDFLIMKKLLPKLGKYKVPVAVYVIIISLMLFSAINMDKQAGKFGLLSIGAILFTFSDSVLALNKFNGKIKHAEPLILSTYFVAQMLFALSI